MSEIHLLSYYIKFRGYFQYENEKKEKLPEEVLAKAMTTEADREPKQVPESPNMKSAEEAPAPKNFEEATKTETEKNSNDLQ